MTLTTNESLLLSQLLYSSNIKTELDLYNADLSLIILNYNNSNLVKLNNSPILTKSSLISYYKNLSSLFNVSSTTDIANILYFNRIAELELELKRCKNEFDSLLC